MSVCLNLELQCFIYDFVSHCEQIFEAQCLQCGSSRQRDQSEQIQPVFLREMLTTNILQ